MKLVHAAKETLIELNKLIESDGTSNVLESIKKQLQFIQTKAEEGKNLADELEEGKKFTYGILASRVFSSPEELVVQDKINTVTVSVTREQNINDFAENMSSEDRLLFRSRHRVRTEIGANTEFTGNGLTANTAEGGGEFGVVETLSLEKDLPLLCDLEDSSVIKTIELKPI